MSEAGDEGLTARNEQTKLLATGVNTIAVAFIVIGFV